MRRKEVMMKRISSFKWIALVLSLIICVGYSSAAYANAEVKETPQVITVPTINLYQEGVPDVDSYQIKIPAGSKEVVQKIEISGRGKLFAYTAATGLSKGFTFELFSDAACTAKLGGSSYISSSTPEALLKCSVLTTGTYYLKVFTYSEVETETLLTFQPYFYNGEDKTLTNKEETGTYAVSYDIPVYHKIVLKKSGYIKLEGKSLDQYSSSISAYLCDSKKRDIGSSYNLTSNNSSTEYIGLKKGTYYIRIKSSSPYKLKYTALTASDQGNKKQSKATYIKKGATKKGVVYATDSTAVSDWFKITLPKDDYIKFDVTTKASGYLAFKIISEDKRQFIMNSTLRVKGNSTEKVVSKDKFLKGTYYIQVTGDSNSSGYYSIKARN